MSGFSDMGKRGGPTERLEALFGLTHAREAGFASADGAPDRGEHGSGLTAINPPRVDKRMLVPFRLYACGGGGSGGIHACTGA
jgi:hypothetical protein